MFAAALDGTGTDLEAVVTVDVIVHTVLIIDEVSERVVDQLPWLTLLPEGGQ